MKRLFFLQPMLWATLFFLFSCKKENVDIEQPPIQDHKYLIPKINAWLDKQKDGLSAVTAARIDSLKLNLSYGEIRLEKYKETKEFIVVPLLSEFKLKDNSERNPANYLVLVFENQDSITRGNIIQYIASNNQKLAPQNTFYKIFTYQDLDCSGQFTILSMTEYFRRELKFEDGKLKSVKELKKKDQSMDGLGKVNECIDWYLQTWFVWSDGSMTLESEVYVFTTCDGDCWQSRIANGRNYGTNCNGGGGGGGIEYDACLNAAVTNFESVVNAAQAVSQTIGFDVSTIDEITKNKNPKWRILQGWSGWELESQEIGVIKLIDQGTNQWAWKSLTHGSISMVGSPPPGVAVEFNQGVGTPSFTPETAAATTVLYAGMKLNFNVTYRLLCDCPYVPVVGQLPPVIKPYTSTSTFWNSNPD